jgi:hypothetical protein
LSVRAKVRVSEVLKPSNSDGQHAEEVTMFPVYGKDGSENANWSKATPSGLIRLYISNPGAWDQFHVGDEFYLDFTEAE